MKVYIMIGCPGAGKSTWVERQELPLVSRDIIREELGMCTSGEKCVGNYKQENEVTRIEEERIGEFLRTRESFAIDDTNLNKKYRTELINCLKKSNVTIVGVKINTPLNLCISRRTNQIPVSVLRNMWEKAQNIDESEFDEFIEVQGY